MEMHNLSLAGERAAAVAQSGEDAIANPSERFGNVSGVANLSTTAPAEDATPASLRQAFATVRSPRRHHDSAERATSLASFWAEFLAGSWRVVRTIHTDQSRYLVLEAASSKRALTERERQVLEGLVDGDAPKQIAYALGLSTGTVAVHQWRGLAKLGINLEAAVQTSWAARLEGEHGSTVGSVWFESARDRECRVLRLPRLATRLPSTLTRSEHEVARLLLEGCSNREIAKQRGVSERTVANQISSIFAKARVCRRIDLLVYLCQVPD